MSRAVASVATRSVRARPVRARTSATKKASARNRRRVKKPLTEEQLRLLEEVKGMAKIMKDPSYEKQVDEWLDEMADNTQPLVEGSMLGTPANAFQRKITDDTTIVVNELIDTAGGLLGGVGSLYGGKTMTIANQLASGVQ